MRICSCNVNGLRAFDSKGSLMDIYKEINPDLVCLQETRCDEESFNLVLSSHDPDLKGHIYPNKCNLGYAGVASIWNSKSYEFSPFHYEEVFNESLDPENYFSGRIQLIPIKVDCDDSDKVVLINVYTLNSGGKDDLRVKWDRLFINMISTLRKSFNVIICGDLNVVKDENDHWKGLSNVVDLGPGLMRYERDGLTMLTNTLGLSDSYKLCHPNGDKKSWFNYRNAAYKRHQGWRIDYFLVDDRLRSRIIDANIYEDLLGSDHRPILLDINL